MNMYEVVYEFQRKLDERVEISLEDLERMFQIVSQTHEMEHRITYSKMKSRFQAQQSSSYSFLG